MYRLPGVRGLASHPACSINTFYVATSANLAAQPFIAYNRYDANIFKNCMTKKITIKVMTERR